MPTRDQAIADLTADGPFKLVTDTTAGYPLRVYAKAPLSLRQVFEASKAHGPRTFTIYGSEVSSFDDIHAKVASLAHDLTARGVKVGDRVAIGMRNYPEWIIGFWACQAIGAVVVALNAWWTTSELAYALEDSAPTALLIDGERFERVLPLTASLGRTQVIVTRRDGAPGGGIDWAETVSKPAAGLPSCAVGPQDLATILYTSGTTGKPKGAFATQRNHVTNIMNTLLGVALSRIMLGVPEDFVAPQGASLQTFPFFHIGGLTGLYLATAMGSKLALMYKWNPAEAVDLIQTHGLTGVSGVPIVVRQLLETAAASGKSLDSLVGVTAGGAPVPPDLIRRVKSQFAAKAAPGNGYGLTETTSAVIANGGADYFAHPESIGRPVPTADIRIVDDQGADVAQGAIGELWIRGPNVIPGYWKNPEATEAAFGGGWFRSGDLGYVDAEGLYYVVDRKKDVIIRGGENIYCAEVEAALLALPFVRDAAVVGLPHEIMGEEVGAVIQVASNRLGDDLRPDILAALQVNLARFKLPTAFAFTDQDLPRTATGKVLKRDIRARFFAG